MVPYNFEENIKQKFESRTIKPSESSWDKLSQELTYYDKKRKQKFWLLGVAASVITVLVVITILFSEEKEISSPATLVETPIEDTKAPEEILTEAETPILKEDVVNNEISLEENIINKTEENHKKTLIIKDNKNAVASSTEAPIISLDNQNELKSVLNEEKAITSNTNTQVALSLEDETNQLLNKALNDLQVEKNKKTEYSLAADALLNDVETELEHSFRMRMFDKIKTGYNTVKTAIAERNQ